MIVALIYEVDMKFLKVQLHNVPNVVTVRASKVEDDKPSGQLLAKNDAGDIVGKFPINNVAGWWIED